MTDNPLYVAFIWHMHQPFYRDPLTGKYRLPWVRLHGTKDYLDMVETLEGFPAVRQNFNLVPSLLEQLIDYSDNRAEDVFLEMSRKRAAELTADERVFILDNFFLANWENMIGVFPRYRELLVKRGTRMLKSDLTRMAKYFTGADILDLQVLFNLCWVDPRFRENDPFLKGLVQKGRDFTEEEKTLLLEAQTDIIRKIIPAYRRASLRGQVELSFTPYCHPILPLLCDTDVARVAMPEAALPRRFSHPEDAEAQIGMGIRYFEKVFGFRPQGMWPSEGSISEEAIKIAGRLGVKWAASDEAVLSRSLGRVFRDEAGNLAEADLLYRPYSYEDVSLVFRDRTLSDLIGFTYSQWDAKRAADDLISRLVETAKTLPEGPWLVPIILDGENAWEYYKDDGRDFFSYLYEGLSKEQRLQTTTVSDFLAGHGSGEPLDRLHPGSWINADFHVWIGHEEDNTAWDYLAETRERLVEYQEENPGADLEAAWKAVFVAEGSDWNWWYGDEHTSETQEEFDELFRLNLIKVYREMGKEAPDHLLTPILRRDRGIAPTTVIRGFIRPKIDGFVTSYYEWYQGGRLDVKRSGGSMHRSEGLISGIYYGFDKDTFYLRVDPRIPLAEFEEGITFTITMTQPAAMKITVPLSAELMKGELFGKDGGNWVKIKEIADVAAGEIFEIALPFSDLRAKEKDEIHFFIDVRKGTDEIERCPWRGHIVVTVPTEDFEATMWD